MYYMGISLKKLRKEVILCLGKYNTFCTLLEAVSALWQYILWVNSEF
jgi:hypothetical protein